MTASRIFLAGVFSTLLALPLFAQPKPDEPSLSWDREIRPLIERHCYHCHREEDASGDVNLRQDENPRLVLRNRKTWETVLEVLRSEEMPPEEGRRLNDGDREKIVTYLEAHLGSINCQTLRDPGTPPARRLTRHEYNLAVEDLTGLPIRPADDFPTEPISFGFVGLGATTGLTPVEVNQYYAAAEDVVEALKTSAESDPKLRDHFFGAPDTVRDRLQQFADRGFRRPADAEFVNRLQRIYDLSIDLGEEHIAAMKNAMSAVLMSPRFFMRIESPTTDEPREEAYLIDAYSLASRLSFFLWSSPPDEELRSLAANGQLLAPEVIEKQVKRMLADRRVADGLVHGFFAQWLGLSNLTAHQVDAAIFPDFSPALSRSMRREVDRLLIEIVRRNRPICELVDPDYTFVDARLAKHYGLAEISDKKIHRVELNDRRRGGLLVSAAILMMQSDPGRTNVPRRGNYVLGTFFGDPPPPPPPAVPALVIDGTSNQPMTLRQRLEEHRANPQCATCHAKMDPIGFSLENYDAIGRWRTRDAGQPIDASARLPAADDVADPVRFEGPEGLKDLVLSRQDDLSRTLIENLLIYALGRGPREIDQCVIDDAMKSLEANEYRFAAIVSTIARSFPFTHRNDPAF